MSLTMTLMVARPAARAAWLDHEGPLPIIEGTLAVEKLPSAHGYHE
ncbi:hypothetical protein ACWGLF_17965 [Streptomyces puniciscabiei]